MELQIILLLRFYSPEDMDAKLIFGVLVLLHTQWLMGGHLSNLKMLNKHIRKLEWEYTLSQIVLQHRRNSNRLSKQPFKNNHIKGQQASS